ncbi:MAG TPA: hypothetical protein VMY16_11595 [Ilumatobacteraceae bacterium]|nr:hypothetical protein [Ilumatobacteraceae bacterium]
METNRRLWNDIIKLAVVVSIIAGFVAIVASVAGGVPQAAIVLPVIVVAFAVSWIQTGRAHRDAAPVRLSAPRTALLRSGSLRHS